MPKARAYKHFKLGELFEIKGIKQAKSQALIPTDSAGIPYVVQSMSNNMVSRLVNRQWLIDNNEPPVKGNVIVLGVTLPAVSYQPVEFGASQVITARAEFLNETKGLYIVSILEKQMQRFSYSKKPGIQIYKDLEIELPVNESGEIDFLFIENYMQAIKDYRIKGLNDFLNAAGFEDCTLTTEEEQALTANVPYKPFDIVKQFNVANSHNILKSDVVFGSGSTPYVTACEGNNSIVSYISYKDEAKEEGNSIMIGGKTLVITYQPEDFFSNDSHNLVLKINDANGRTETAQLFMVAALYKSLSPKYSWGDSISKTKIQRDKVSFPVDSNGSIDYNFMETYIRAIMKQTIGKLKAAMTIDSEDIVVEEDEPIILDSVPVSERFTRFLPIYDVAIACGALVDEGVQSLGRNDVDMEGWIDVSDYGFKPNEQMFVVHTKGESMLPKIHPGDLCVFELYGVMGNAGSREGQIVLARQHGKDSDYNCQYTIKQYHSEKDPLTGRNIKVELRPLNQDTRYKVIDVEEEDGEIRIIATLKRVLN